MLEWLCGPAREVYSRGEEVGQVERCRGARQLISRDLSAGRTEAETRRVGAEGTDSVPCLPGLGLVSLGAHGRGSGSTRSRAGPGEVRDGDSNRDLRDRSAKSTVTQVRWTHVDVPATGERTVDGARIVGQKVLVLESRRRQDNGREREVRCIDDFLSQSLSSVG